MNISDFSHIISQKKLQFAYKNPYVVQVEDAPAGFILAKELIYTIGDKKTVLFLSGGKTPKQLYASLGSEAKLSVGAVGLIDERYGEKMHEQSNELMISESGLLNYMASQNIPFYPILQKDTSLSQTALKYDETVRFLYNGFAKSIGVLGIGLDGHTAGLPANASLWQAGIARESKTKMVISYDDKDGFYKKRITMTFLGLSLLDFNLVLVFGEEKKKALENMLAEDPPAGGEEEIPARFFKRPEIGQKTLVITDQKV